MSDVKKASVLSVVVVHRDRSELEQFQELELAAAMVGGEVGQAVLSGLAAIRDDVIGRAV